MFCRNLHRDGNGIVYVMTDATLFAPGRYPDGDEDPPVMEELLEAPEGADLLDVLRVKEYNMKVVTRYETRHIRITTLVSIFTSAICSELSP